MYIYLAQDLRWSFKAKIYIFQPLTTTCFLESGMDAKQLMFMLTDLVKSVVYLSVNVMYVCLSLL